MQQYSTHSYRTHTTQTLAQEKPLVELDHPISLHQGGEQINQEGVIKILLVDDHTLVREGLHYLCAMQEGLEVVGVATESIVAMRLVEKLQPDVVLVDIHQSAIDAMILVRRISQNFSNTVVLLLTMKRSQQYITQAFKNGARGYLHTSVSFAEVMRAIRIVHDGGTYVAQELASSLYRDSSHGGLRTAASELQLIDVLTEKEIEIVRHVATGMSNKEIADKLAYSEKTVKNYLSTVFQKLNIRDRTQAAILALKQGVLDA